MLSATRGVAQIPAVRYGTRTSRGRGFRVSAQLSGRFAPQSQLPYAASVLRATSAHNSSRSVASDSAMERIVYGIM